MTSEVIDPSATGPHDRAMTTTDPTTRTDTPDPASSARRAALDRSQRHRAERRLRGTLRANAATSFVSGALLAIAPDRLDELLGTGRPGWVRTVGIAVVGFGLVVGWLSVRPVDELMRDTPVVVAADVGWVVLSIVTILLGWYDGGGIVAVLAMAVAVDTFAFLQFTSWRTLRRTR